VQIHRVLREGRGEEEEEGGGADAAATRGNPSRKWYESNERRPAEPFQLLLFGRRGRPPLKVAAR